MGDPLMAGQQTTGAGGRLPSFLVIGAVKAATTWISEQLRQHPLLWLPRAEPHYFSTEYDRGLQWYRSVFSEAPADRIVGEKSADYLGHPEAAKRIAGLLPEVPMIAQLRDPVERAYSDYRMLYRRGSVGPDPRYYLEPGRAANARFLEGGRYATHIRRLREHLPEARLKVILYEDIAGDPRRVIAAVCEHIGVPVHIAQGVLLRRSNDSDSPMLPLPLRRLLKPARPLLDPLRENPWLRTAHRMLAQPVQYPALSAELNQMLRSFYRDEILELSTMLNRDLGGWLNEDNTPEQASHVCANRGGRR
jgi:Sulfotransferase family